MSEHLLYRFVVFIYAVLYPVMLILLAGISYKHINAVLIFSIIGGYQEIVMDIEDHFDVIIDSNQNLKSIGDLVKLCQK